MIELICSFCKRNFLRLARYERNNRKQGKAGPYCGRSCSAKNHMKGNKNAKVTPHGGIGRRATPRR